jgi:ABC-type Zn uptake system ZnuABC Zn-binding protein ZnuA
MLKLRTAHRSQAIVGRLAAMLFILFALVGLPTQTAAAILERPAPADRAQPATARIAVSTPIFADIVASVAGDRFTVISVIPASADPHTFEASPQERGGALPQPLVHLHGRQP